MKLKKDLFTVGCDRSSQLCEVAREKYSHVPIVIADNLHLPYRDDLFDAVLSIGVIHHLSTHKRRVQAVQGLTRSYFSLTNQSDDLEQISFRMFADFETEWWSFVDLRVGNGTETSSSNFKQNEKLFSNEFFLWILVF